MMELQRSFSRANAELIESFGRHLVSRNASPATTRSYLDTVHRLADFFGSTSLLGAEACDIREFLSTLQERGLHPATLALHTSAMRTFYKFLRQSEFTQRDPLLRIARRKIPKRIARLLTLAEIERLIAAAETPFEHAVIETLYATGVRCAEAANIQIQDIDFPNRTIRINNGKGGKDRFVLFGRYAEAAIREYLVLRGTLTGHDYLFDYTAGWIRLTVSTVGWRAGLGQVFPHMIRRAMASHMCKHGADLRCVQELLGHESVRTTMIYVQYSQSDLQETYLKFHPHAELETAHAAL